MRALWIALGAIALAAIAAMFWLLQRERANEAVAPAAREVAADRTVDPVLLSAESAPPGVAEVSAGEQRELIAAAPSEKVRTEAEQAILVVFVRSKETLEPLERVRIVVWPDPAEPGFGISGGTTSQASFGTSPITNDSGRAQVTVPPGQRFRLVAQQDDNQSSSAEKAIEPLAAGETRELDLLLATQADRHFVLHIVDDATGAALAAARVSVGDVEELIRNSADAETSEQSAALSPKPTMRVLAVDADGFVELDMCSWQETAVRAEAPGFAWALVRPAAGHETRATAFEMRLSAAAALEFLAFGPGRFPLEGAHIRVSANTYEVSQTLGTFGNWFTEEPVRWEVLSGPDGRARIDALPPGVPLKLESAAPGSKAYQKVSEPPPLQPGETRTIEVGIGSGATVAGRLSGSDGTPMQGTMIWMKPWTGARSALFYSHERDEMRTAGTKEGGRFAFEDVPDGEWVLAPAPDGAHLAAAERVLVRGGFADREVLLTVVPGLYIRGRVVDASGQPSSGYVWAFCVDPPSSADGRADKDGRFEVGPLRPGTYSIQAHASAGPSASGSSPLIEVAAGAEDVLLTLTAGGIVAGRVVDSATGKAVQAQVLLAPVRGEHEQGLVTTISSTDVDGEFSQEAVAPGVYCLSAVASGNCGVLREIRVDAGAKLEDLIVRVEPGGRLRVHYDGTEQFASFQVLDGQAVVAMDGVRRGTSATWAVPAGQLSVKCAERFGLGATSQTKEVTVVVGELADVHFGSEGEKR